ncbi:hypothetical protein QTP88_003626 [Uroleucon formosanum]
MKNETWRFICYKQYTSWVNSWIAMGRGNRVVLPACVVQKIREEYPEPNGIYPPESLEANYEMAKHSTAIDVECSDEYPPESLEAENETAKNSTVIENECSEEYEFDESSWLLCAGHIEDIVSNLVECRALLTKLKSDSTPNSIIFLLES